MRGPGRAGAVAALVALGIAALLFVAGGRDVSPELQQLYARADAVREEATAGGRLDCQQCHGVPPQSGAHPVHADAAGYAFGFDCATCHYVGEFPALHDNGSVEVRFRPSLAEGNDLAGAYSRGTCADLYCHSDGRGEALPVSWRSAADSTLGSRASGNRGDTGCGSCHDVRGSAEIDMSGEHAFHLNTAVECSGCHAGIVDLADRIIDYARHVDGNVDVSVLAGSYDVTTRGCSPGCHDTRSWR